MNQHYRTPKHFLHMNDCSQAEQVGMLSAGSSQSGRVISKVQPIPEARPGGGGRTTRSRASQAAQAAAAEAAEEEEQGVEGTSEGTADDPMILLQVNALPLGKLRPPCLVKCNTVNSKKLRSQPY